eukprot:TRINITY_DN1929_c1_g1_i2.p1 TRINITY_DN1929_c1_g1~~TRINITY_DN1929_c1_g1_i2.p1  ORF type:complete len:140 (-),score=22.10 TRINITY_DN1929_c1_g1_i2:59-478(-)
MLREGASRKNEDSKLLRRRSTTYSAQNKDSLFHVYTLFREVIQTRNIKQVEVLLSKENRQLIGAAYAEFENASSLDEFWGFLEHPPLNRIQFVSDMKSLETGILVLQSVDEENQIRRGEITFAKEDANGDWLITKEDWD